MAIVNVTIRMPEEWVDAFWGWFLDGGGDIGFRETCCDMVDGYKAGTNFSAWDGEEIPNSHTSVCPSEARRTSVTTEPTAEQEGQT